MTLDNNQAAQIWSLDDLVLSAQCAEAPAFAHILIPLSIRFVRWTFSNGLHINRAFEWWLILNVIQLKAEAFSHLLHHLMCGRALVYNHVRVFWSVESVFLPEGMTTLLTFFQAHLMMNAEVIKKKEERRKKRIVVSCWE